MDHSRPSHGSPPPPFPNLKGNTTCLVSFFLVLFTSLFFLNALDPYSTFSTLRLHSFSLHTPSSPTNTSSCDYSNGRWVRDEAAALHSYTEDCAFLDPGFKCNRNGRQDMDYRRWRWQPNNCDIARFNASRMLERCRNMKIVFAGDSIGRNQWESLVCMLAKGVGNQSTIYEQNGNPITKHKGYLSIRFHGHNLTVEYYRLPFLVTVGRPPRNSSRQVKKVVRLDQLHWVSRKWVGADILVFNAGHWWNPEKTVKMGFYFEEGKRVNMTMDIKEAFRRTLGTWKRWVLGNVDPKKTRIFFRSYAPTHFRGGKWNEGGRCDLFTGPETNLTELGTEPWNNQVIWEAVKDIKATTEMRAWFLNITLLTQFRRDGHPSLHREPGTPVPAPQDCSHWCLPGIPDTWNELLYGHLLANDVGGKYQGPPLY